MRRFFASIMPARHKTIVCAIAHRFPSWGEKQLKTQLKKVLKTYFITRIEACERKYLHLLAQLANVGFIKIMHCKGGSTTFEVRAGQEGCLCLMGARKNIALHGHSLAVMVPLTPFVCQRCRQTVYGRRMRLKHAVRCARRHKQAYHWRRTQQANAPGSRLTTLTFNAGSYIKSPQNVEQLAHSLGIDSGGVFQTQRAYCCLDIECALPTLSMHARRSLGLAGVACDHNVHELLLVVVAYRLPDWQTVKTRLFWQQPRRPRAMVNSLVTFLNRLSLRVSSKLREGHFRPLLERIERSRQLHQSNGLLLKQLSGLQTQVDRFINRLLVIGYNTGSYDLPVLRRYGLLETLKLNAPQDDFVIIKKRSNYMSIVTDRLKFVDVMHYSPLKCPLSSFMKTFGTKDSETKGMFPHGVVKRHSDLATPLESLTLSDFSNVLLGVNSLCEPYSDYCRLRREGLTELHVLQRLQLEVCLRCQLLWSMPHAESFRLDRYREPLNSADSKENGDCKDGTQCAT